MRQPKPLRPATILLAFIVFPFTSLFAQTTYIQGPTCVAPGVEYQYTAVGGWIASTTIRWCLNGGHMSGTVDVCKSGTPLVYIRVIWDNFGSGNVTGNITVDMSTPGVPSGTTYGTITITPVFKSGSLSSNINQALPYYTLPA